MNNLTLNEYVNGLKDKSIAVIGIGVSNLPLIRLLAGEGCDVTACDKRSAQALGDVFEELSFLGVKFKLGEDYLSELNFDVIFRTPGLHPMFLDKAKEQGSLVTSEMEAFFALCPCRIIAITGSDGKTTTSTLISELLKAEGYKVHLGGNIGKPLLCDVPQMSKDDVAVLELSSFQLHSMVCHPNVSVITNISPNHLDVHPSYEDYQIAKKNIFTGQNIHDRLVLNLDNEITASYAGEASSSVSFFSRLKEVEKGCCIKDEAIFFNGEKIVDKADILLPGEHNVENYMAAIAATEGLVSRESIISVARNFGGVEHRIELVRVHKGVRYYNDSIASSPSRTVAGLKSFKEKTILIAGGYDKKIGFEPLAEEAIKSVKALYLCGHTAEKIKIAVESAEGYDSSALPIYVFDDFTVTVLAAAASASEGDVVIMSPACASFDKFKNFAERGKRFKEIIGGLN